jgi:hypothetical protein
MAKSKGKNGYWYVVGIGMGLPIIFAMLDLIGAKMWRTLGGWAADAYIRAEPTYMALFWIFAYTMVFAIALTYWFVKRDKSEAIALGLIPVVLLQFGAEDIWFYLFGGHQLFGVTMPWLTENLWPLTIVSWMLGEPVVTGYTLLAGAMIGYLLSAVIAKKLLEVKG